MSQVRSFGRGVEFWILLSVFVTFCSEVSCKTGTKRYVRGGGIVGPNVEDLKGKNDHRIGIVGDSSRSPKILPLFGYVTFPQDTCIGSQGQTGVCTKRSVCNNLNGTSVGTCAFSFGTCCMITSACSTESQTITTNGTVLTQGTAFVPNGCVYTIPKQRGVCQIRLDFTSFVIDDMGPGVLLNGTCDTDTLTISGNSNSQLGPLCGNLTGQHMYLDYGGNDKITLDIFLTKMMGQQWNIMVTMIRCDSVQRAPEGCLQYFTGQRGMVTSFDYNNRRQLDTQDYAVCIKAMDGAKKITWRSCGAVDDFFVTGTPPVLGVANDQIDGSVCSLDWVMIFGANKYCGNTFPESVSTSTQPFMMQVHFNDFELATWPHNNDPCGTNGVPCMTDIPPDQANTGFCLMYAQSSF